MADSTLFQRVILPGLAFKAVAIGGGYATGRELAEFFVPHGAWGGLLAMTISAVIWSLVCAATFAFAQATTSHDYRRFFEALLGPIWPLFEIGYLSLVILTLSVFAAAAGEIGTALLGVPKLAGTAVLALGIGLFASAGNNAVEWLFKYVSFFLYGMYALLLLLALNAFGDLIPPSFNQPIITTGITDGFAYAGYNVVCAIAILPVVRHMRGRRDAVIAGLLCGPLAMAPAMLFFVCMMAFAPGIATEALPSDYLLERLGQPWFHLLFQLLILAALLESGTGAVHAINESIAGSFAKRNRTSPRWIRPLASIGILVAAIVIADSIGLVTLIAKGYRGLSFFFLAIYVVPVMTIGLWRLRAMRRNAA